MRVKNSCASKCSRMFTVEKGEKKDSISLKFYFLFLFFLGIQLMKTTETATVRPVLIWAMTAD